MGAFKSIHGLGFALVLLGLVFPLNLRGGQLVTTIGDGSDVFYFRVLLSKRGCQLAIWLTDEKGAFVDTIYVTRYVAKKGLGNRIH